MFSSRTPVQADDVVGDKKATLNFQKVLFAEDM
jgi:hypothetical protein